MRRSIPVLALIAGAACGRIAFEPMPDGGSRPGDAPDSSSTCELGPWTAPRHQAALATVEQDWEPVLHPNNLVVVYASHNGGTSHLYIAERASVEDDFGAPTQIVSGSREDHPSWSVTGDKLHFIRDNFASNRAILAAPYLGGTAFGPEEPSDLPLTGHSHARSSDDREVFYSRVAAVNDEDLGHASRSGPGAPWEEDMLLAGLNRTGAFLSEGWPWFDSSRDTLYFEQYTPTGPALAMSQRDGGQFGPIVLLDDLNAGAFETGDPSLSADGTMMLFGSERPGGAGANDIYLVTRACQ